MNAGLFVWLIMVIDVVICTFIGYQVDKYRIKRGKKPY